MRSLNNDDGGFAGLFADLMTALFGSGFLYATIITLMLALLLQSAQHQAERDRQVAEALGHNGLRQGTEGLVLLVDLACGDDHRERAKRLLRGLADKKFALIGYSDRLYAYSSRLEDASPQNLTTACARLESWPQGRSRQTLDAIDSGLQLAGATKLVLVSAGPPAFGASEVLDFVAGSEGLPIDCIDFEAAPSALLKQISEVTDGHYARGEG